MSSLLSYWPRRGTDLPPGQRHLDVFPRFGAQPLRPPPVVNGPRALVVAGEGMHEPVTIGSAALDALPRRNQRSDLHCVTTWSAQDLRWGGVAMREVWRALVQPRLDPDSRIRYVQAVGADGYRATLLVDDLLGPNVLVADTLDNAPLDARHGAPLRLVSPSQYGYKSVKHLERLILHARRPPGRLGPKEHLRARVAREERHSRLPGRLLRVPYRSLVPITAHLAERSARSPRLVPSTNRPQE